MGDWNAVIFGLPHQVWLLVAGLYLLVVRVLAITVRVFTPDRATYNVTGRLPYYAACVFSCAAGALDPLGLKLFFMSTVPAALGGSSGLMWADLLMPRAEPEKKLVVVERPLGGLPRRSWEFATSCFLGGGLSFRIDAILYR